jgi:GAF domain-containing protein
MAVDEQALVASLQTLLTHIDLPSDTPTQAARRRLTALLAAATEVLAVDSVGLMLLDDHNVLRVVGVSDDSGAGFGLAQQQLGVGPALDCLRLGETVVVDDLADNPDYVLLWARLEGAEDRIWHRDRQPIRAVVSAVVHIRDSVIGNLNAIRTAPYRWQQADTRAVEAYAAIVGVLLCLGLPASTPTDAQVMGPADDGTSGSEWQ